MGTTKTNRNHSKSRATKTTLSTENAQPVLHQRARATQSYGSVIQEVPLGLTVETREAMVKSFNRVLADSITLRDLYKKSHWQVSGATFYSLHLLFDKHYAEQSEIIDTIAERIQLLGGISVAMAADVAEMTTIPRPPMGREELPVQISRLLEAHEMIIKKSRAGAKQAEELEDPGSNDVFVSDVLRVNELQVWFLYEHLVNSPLVIAR